MSESFLVKEEDGYYEWQRRPDGWWQKQPLLVVEKGGRKLKPIKGSRVSLVDDGLLDVQKGAYEDEQRKIMERIRRLEQMSYEERAMEKIRQGGILSVGQPSTKVQVQTQPSVQKLDTIVNETIKRILRYQYCTIGADGRVYVKQNVPLLLKQTAKTLQR